MGMVFTIICTALVFGWVSRLVECHCVFTGSKTPLGIMDIGSGVYVITVSEHTQKGCIGLQELNIIENKFNQVFMRAVRMILRLVMDMTYDLDGNCSNDDTCIVFHSNSSR